MTVTEELFVQTIHAVTDVWSERFILLSALVLTLSCIILLLDLQNLSFVILVSCTSKQYTEADLYKQLAYFCYILDSVRCFDKVSFLSLV